MNSMQPDVEDRLAEGGRALDAVACEEVRDAFEPRVAGEKLPEALDGYGLALWCTPHESACQASS